MSLFRISGIWKDTNNVITHYAFHKIDEKGTYRAVKTSKAQAIALLEVVGNHATTWVWNYSLARWQIGEEVEVIQGIRGKYLRSNPDNQLTDNLGHLINIDWIVP